MTALDDPVVTDPAWGRHLNRVTVPVAGGRCPACTETRGYYDVYATVVRWPCGHLEALAPLSAQGRRRR